MVRGGIRVHGAHPKSVLLRAQDELEIARDDGANAQIVRIAGRLLPCATVDAAAGVVALRVQHDLGPGRHLDLTDHVRPHVVAVHRRHELLQHAG